MSGGVFDYVDLDLRDKIFGYRYEKEKIPNVFEDREISEIIFDILNLIHEFDWYKSGDTGKEKYLNKKSEFKKKWLNNRGVRVRNVIDKAIKELKDELYETYEIS